MNRCLPLGHPFGCHLSKLVREKGPAHGMVPWRNELKKMRNKDSLTLILWPDQEICISPLSPKYMRHLRI